MIFGKYADRLYSDRLYPDSVIFMGGIRIGLCLIVYADRLYSDLLYPDTLYRDALYPDARAEPGEVSVRACCYPIAPSDIAFYSEKPIQTALDTEQSSYKLLAL